MDYNYQPLRTNFGPHIRENWTSNWIMHQVLIALFIPTFSAYIYFGFNSVVMVLISILFCVILENLVKKFFNLKYITQDLTAIITGWLLALMLPITTPIWVILLGDFIAIIFIKHFSGGLGRNWLNPAVASRVILKLFFSPWITNWVEPGPEAITTATPLVELGHFAKHVTANVPNLWELLIGWDLGGPIGETNKLALVFAYVYLVLRKVINVEIPLITLSSFYTIILLYSGFDFYFATSHLLSGSLVFAAVFMVTDYTTTPYTNMGKYLFALGCGALCAVLRITLDLPGGIGIAILIMNILTPCMNKICTNRIYGTI